MPSSEASLTPPVLTASAASLGSLSTPARTVPRRDTQPASAWAAAISVTRWWRYDDVVYGGGEVVMVLVVVKVLIVLMVGWQLSLHNIPSAGSQPGRAVHQEELPLWLRHVSSELPVPARARQAGGEQQQLQPELHRPLLHLQPTLPWPRGPRGGRDGSVCGVRGLVPRPPPRQGLHHLRLPCWGILRGDDLLPVRRKVNKAGMSDSCERLVYKGHNAHP